MLQDQIRIDIAAEFPGWRVRQRPGGWSAIRCGRPESSDGAVVQLMYYPAIGGLQQALRARRGGQVILHEA